MELSLLSSEIEKYVILKQECWNLSYFRKQVRGTEDQLTSSKFKWWNRNQMWTKNKNWQQFQHFLIKEVLFYLKWNLTKSFQRSIFWSLIFHVRDKVFWYKTTRYSWCWCMICLLVQRDMRCWSAQYKKMFEMFSICLPELVSTDRAGVAQDYCYKNFQKKMKTED